MLPVTVIKQGVALTGRNRTGPPCNVGRPTTHAPGSVTDDDDRRQRQRAKQYWRIRRGSNNYTRYYSSVLNNSGVCLGDKRLILASPEMQEIKIEN